MNQYRTTRDIIIVAGTVVSPGPRASTRWGSDFEAVVGLGRDHSGYFSLDVQEGLESGYIEEVRK